MTHMDHKNYDKSLKYRCAAKVFYATTRMYLHYTQKGDKNAT